MIMLRFEDGTVDLTEPHPVALRFRIAEHLARMRYGTAILLPRDLVMKCWPPTGEHAPRPYISARDMAALVDTLLADDRPPQERPQPETSYTSLERVQNDLPDDGSFVVEEVIRYDDPDRSGIKVYRKLQSCPRCKGTGFERYHTPLPSSGKVGSISAVGLLSVSVKERRCDHRPR